MVVTLYEELDTDTLEKQYHLCDHIHLSNDPQPDWADLLAGKWLKAIKDIYKEKGMPKNKFAQAIVSAQGREFGAAVDTHFGSDINFDTPDYGMREALKKNTWHFSIAKNHNDLKALNNLLLKEDDSLRSWSEFKREAQKVVGSSIKYLQTEYNTIVAGAQMSRLWAEIQRDKHIFPFIEFEVVKDGHTSEICTPLYKVVVSVDDPMLLIYFPPNHFNCRTTIRKLRRGVPTKDPILPEIPDAFKNNIGVTGKLFTSKNEYIKNTPEDLIDAANSLYAKNTENSIKEASIEIRKQFEAYKLKYPMYQTTSNKLVMYSLWADRMELERNLEVAKIVANKYQLQINITAHTDGKILLNRANSEYLIDGVIGDRKSPKGLNLKNIFRTANNKQNCETVIIDLENNSNTVVAMLNAVKNKLRDKTIYPKIKKVIIVSKDMKKLEEFTR